MKKTSRGFTLIELLVVVAIISILSSVIATSVSASRVKARETVRKQNLKQLENALQLYVTDNGGYPGDEVPFSFEYSCGSFNQIQSIGALEDALVPKYISRIPTETVAGSCYTYYSGSDFSLANNALITVPSEEIKDTDGNNAIIGIGIGSPDFTQYPTNGFPSPAVDIITNTGYQSGRVY